MQITCTIPDAAAQVLVTDMQNVGPHGWQHAQVTGSASSELNARTLAQQIIELLSHGREIQWRVPFEYKPRTRLTQGGKVEGWHLFARFSFRTRTTTPARQT